MKLQIKEKVPNQITIVLLEQIMQTNSECTTKKKQLF